MKKNNGQASIKILVSILTILIIVLAILLVIKIKNEKNMEEVNATDVEVQEEEQEEKEEEEPIKIYQGTDRPIAVMIDNVGDAVPQAGLNKAYVVYEIIVEGGYSRLMAIFKGQDLEKIGPVRSSRHYFLDYALENDAIYVHYGWSPQAQKDISALNVNNINGITVSSVFWRVKDKAAPHNAVASTEKILQYAQTQGYRTTSQAKSVLNYVSKEFDLEGEDAIDAKTVKIPYSRLYNVSYTYNEETKRYERNENEQPHKDWDTKEIISTKNIIITFAKNTVLNDGENKDRQNLNNIGELDGYYITNGKAIKIKCTKTSRTAKTEYKDLEGNVINVNDGNTFIQICPIDADVTIE